MTLDARSEYEDGKRHLTQPFVCVFEFDDENALREWRVEQDSCYRLSRASDNGLHVAIWARPDVRSPDFGSGKVRVGMLAPEADHID